MPAKGVEEIGLKRISKIISLFALSIAFIGIFFVTTVYAYETPDGSSIYQEQFHDEILFGPVLVGDEYTIIDLRMRLSGNWVQRGVFWYFYHNGQQLRNRWMQDSQGRWFWFHPTGRMATEWFQDAHGRWFFLNPRFGIAGHQTGIAEGVMITGWLQRGANWFFLNPRSGVRGHQSGISEGVMRTGNFILIHDTYHSFNSSGVWQGRSQAFDIRRHNSEVWPRSSSDVTTIPIRNLSAPNQSWLSAMNRAVNDWNNSNAHINFSQNSTSNNLTNVQNNANPWFGLIEMQVNTNTRHISRFNITLNHRTISNSATSLDNFITSVMSHELGHVLGLADNPTNVTGSNGSLMNHARNRNILISPLPVDIASVNLRY